MGVTCTFYSVTPEQVAVIARRPALVQLLWTDQGWDSGRSLAERLLSRPTPACMTDLTQSMSLDLDKAWHGLHYLLSGSAGTAPLPQGFLLAGGKDIGHDSRLVSPGQAREFGVFVRSVEPAHIRSRYAPETMARLEIYPAIIWQRDQAEALDYVLEFFDRLPAFFRDIEAEGHGYVISIA